MPHKLNGKMHSKVERHPRAVFIGPPSVGKTSLIEKLTKGEMGQHPPTTGNVYQRYETNDEKHPILEMWDTAGMERFRAVNPAFYREANCAFLVFNLCRYDSFESLEGWYNDFVSSSQAGVPILLVGNQCDREDSIEVMDNEIQSWASERNIEWIKTSAATGEGVNAMIKKMIEMIPEVEHVDITPIVPEDEKKCC